MPLGREEKFEPKRATESAKERIARERGARKVPECTRYEQIKVGETLFLTAGVTEVEMKTIHVYVGEMSSESALLGLLIDGEVVKERYLSEGFNEFGDLSLEQDDVVELSLIQRDDVEDRQIRDVAVYYHFRGE